MELTIRAARAEDYEALCLIYAEIDELHHAYLPERFQEPAEPARTKDFLLGRFADEAVAFLVAEAQGALLGFAQASVMSTAVTIPTLRPRRYVYLHEIVVRDEFHRQGIGGRLMAAVEDWARGQGVEEIELGVYEFNQGAIAYYERRGYKTLHRKMSKKL